MSMDSELQKHYALLLGVGSPWEVKDVELKLAEKTGRLAGRLIGRGGHGG